MMNKLYKNASDAIFDLKDNSVIMLGGFGLWEFLKTLYLLLSKEDHETHVSRIMLELMTLNWTSIKN